MAKIKMENQQNVTQSESLKPQILHVAQSEPQVEHSVRMRIIEKTNLRIFKTQAFLRQSI